MAVLAVAPTVVTGLLLIRTATTAAQMRPEESLTRETTTLATAVASWLDSQSAALSGWRRVWNVDAKSPELQEGLLRAVYTAVDSVVTVALIDEEGRPAVDPVWLGAGMVDAGRTAGSDARANALLVHAPRTTPANGIAFAAPYVPPGETMPVVAVSVAPPGSDLLLAAELSLRPLSHLFGGRDDHASVLLDGTSRPLLGGEHPLVADGQVQAMAESGMDLSFSPLTAEGARLRGAVTSVPGTDWVVVAAEPADLAAEASASMRTQTLLIGLLVLVAGTLAGYAMERTIARPVNRLREGATAIAAGELEQRIDEDGVDEFRELADAFNNMSARLLENREELDHRQQRIEAFNEELQARVAERTAALEATQARLVQAGQIAAVGEVGAGLAHELNNPMTAILGTVQLMQVKGEGEPEALARIEEQVLRCREVVATMVRFAAGEVDPRLAPVVDLAEITRATVEELRAPYMGRDLEFECEISSEPALTRMEPAVAHQMVSRIMEAVSVGLAEAGAVVVKLEVRDGFVELDVDASPRPVTDDQRASGMRGWVTRRMVDLAGGVVQTAADGGAPWHVRLPVA